jgi:transcriptional regulator with XRE-family HTH domain
MGMLRHLGPSLRRARRAERVAAREVAVRANVDVATVYRFERGEAWPRDPDRLVDAYAAILRVRPVALWVHGVRGWADSEREGQP